MKTVELLMPSEGTQNYLITTVPKKCASKLQYMCMIYDHNTLRGSWLPSATGTSGWPAFSHCESSIADVAELAL